MKQIFIFSNVLLKLALFYLSIPTLNAQPSTTIEDSPAFSAEQLLALPTDGWLTNGGNLYNQRYSPLTQINRDNVSSLKAV